MIANQANIRGLKQCHSSNRYDFFVEHGSKHEEAMRCCKDPNVVHKSNRKKIFVNFESKEVRTYIKKTKTTVTRMFPPGVYMECFKGCNSDNPKLAYLHKPSQEAPVRPDCVIDPAVPIKPGDTAIQIEVPKHDRFSVEIRGIGTFTNASDYIRHPFSANPIPRIKMGVESPEVFQNWGGDTEVRCFLV